MAYNFLSLDDALADLPTLRAVLGDEWINRERQTPAIESRFPLARTLRIEELRNLVVTLDRRLAALWDTNGASDWRRRLRNNGQEFRELLTEVAFASLLQARGYAFEHPDDGPDFSVVVSDGPPLKIEAITPRVIAWDDDLHLRLWVLSRQFGYSVRFDPLGEEQPILSKEITERKMQEIVSDTVELLSTASSETSVIERLYSDIGLRLKWTLSSDPIYSGRNSPNSSFGRGFNYVWTAAEQKVKQLRRGDAHTLLIGTNQLPLSDWGPYVRSLRGQLPFHGGFDWSQIHSRVHHIILFEATYGDSRHPAIDVLVRPGDSGRDSDGLSRFFEGLRLAGEDYLRQSAEDERQLVERLVRLEEATKCNETQDK